MKLIKNKLFNVVAHSNVLLGPCSVSTGCDRAGLCHHTNQDPLCSFTIWDTGGAVYSVSSPTGWGIQAGEDKDITWICDKHLPQCHAVELNLHIFLTTETGFPSKHYFILFTRKRHSSFLHKSFSPTCHYLT